MIGIFYFDICYVVIYLLYHASYIHYYMTLFRALFLYKSDLYFIRCSIVSKTLQTQPTILLG